MFHCIMNNSTENYSVSFFFFFTTCPCMLHGITLIFLKMSANQYSHRATLHVPVLELANLLF